MDTTAQIPSEDRLADDWFARGEPEDTLLADLEIVDCHHHLYIRPTAHYHVPQLVRDLESGHRVVATVYVEAMEHYRPDGPAALKPVGETEHLLALIHEHGRELGGGLAGIVGAADLMLGDEVEAVLEAHLEAGEGRFRGVRAHAQWDPSGYTLGSMRPPEGMLLDAGFQRGVKVVSRLGLSCDLLYFFHQGLEVAALADAVPDCPIVVNHFGWPLGEGPYEGRLPEVMDRWRALLPELARRPNIVMKVGGLGSPWSGLMFDRDAPPPNSQTLAETWAPYFHETIAAFGPSRCLMESNFPVDRRTCAYHTLWNALKRIGLEYSPAERTQMFSEAARKVYRIGSASQVREANLSAAGSAA